MEAEFNFVGPVKADVVIILVAKAASFPFVTLCRQVVGAPRGGVRIDRNKNRALAPWVGAIMGPDFFPLS